MIEFIKINSFESKIVIMKSFKKYTAMVISIIIGMVILQILKISFLSLLPSNFEKVGIR